jgi:NADH/NAD ratio-sensing transcriptional regulator Rex
MSEAYPTLQELQSIKKLLVLLLIKSGATSEEIGRALGVDSSTIRKMFPMRKTKKAEGD